MRPHLAMLPALVLLLTLSCQQRPAPSGPTATDADRVHALLVNGGGQPAANYYSHLRHLEEMEDVLRAAGIPAARTTALSSDGDDPGLDLATREAATDESFWLVRGTPLENALRRAAGDPGYAGGFIERYLGALIYPAGLTPATQWLLGLGLLLVNVALYAWVGRRRRARHPFARGSVTREGEAAE